MTGRRSRPEPLADALASYLEKSGIAAGAERRRVFVEWRERVGDRIADVATPLRLDRGTLIVGVRSSAWLMELKLMERRLVERLNTGLGESGIDQIRLVLGHPETGGETGRGTREKSGSDG